MHFVYTSAVSICSDRSASVQGGRSTADAFEAVLLPLGDFGVSPIVFSNDARLILCETVSSLTL